MKYKTINRYLIKFGIKVFLLAGLIGLVNAANIAQVAKIAPGDTATAGAGKQWPTTRFVVSGDCVSDKLTGLMWPKNGIIGFEATDGGGPIAQPNYANTKAILNDINWTQALTAVANMNTAPTKLCGYSDWRLPNINELKSLVNYASVSPASWLNGQGFTNVRAASYWSSSGSATNPVSAWGVDFNDGFVGTAVKATTYLFVWPVRGGQ